MGYAEAKITAQARLGQISYEASHDALDLFGVRASSGLTTTDWSAEVTVHIVPEALDLQVDETGRSLILVVSGRYPKDMAPIEERVALNLDTGEEVGRGAAAR